VYSIAAKTIPNTLKDLLLYTGISGFLVLLVLDAPFLLFVIVIVGTMLTGYLLIGATAKNQDIAHVFIVDNEGRVLRSSNEDMQTGAVVSVQSKVCDWFVYLCIENRATQIRVGYWVLKNTVSDRSFRRISRIVRNVKD